MFPPPPQAELTELVQTYKQEVTEAACELICDWAQKILKRSFDTVVEIARYLIQEHIVNPRCSQAELVTSAALAGQREGESGLRFIFHQICVVVAAESLCVSAGGPAKPHKVIKKTPVISKPEGEGAADQKVITVFLSLTLFTSCRCCSSLPVCLQKELGDSSSSSSLKTPAGDKPAAAKPSSLDAPPPSSSSSSLRPAVGHLHLPAPVFTYNT